MNLSKADGRVHDQGGTWPWGNWELDLSLGASHHYFRVIKKEVAKHLAGFQEENGPQQAVVAFTTEARLHALL